MITNAQCVRDLPENVIRDNQICTYAPGKDSCQSDSGGPLYYYDHNSASLLQLGIISYGLACATSRPGVNVRVSSHLVWIVSVTNGMYIQKTRMGHRADFLRRNTAVLP